MPTPSPAPAFLTLPEAGDSTYRKVLRKVRLRALGHLLHLAAGASDPRLAALARVLPPTAKKHTATLYFMNVKTCVQTHHESGA